MANTSARTAPEIDASQPSQNDLMQRLANSLAGEKASATFACGGKILTTVERGSVAPDSPIVFYEDKTGQSHKITFPASPEEMEKLASDCDPASFGVGGEDVMDLDYRSAWKLDNTKFATNFHPSDSDVMDVIKQFLLCGALKPQVIDPIISAKLYKLNIYKGPHDKFKPHVDTPRSENQFGSLVVCLPSAHTGGELVVRHDGREVVFNWNTESKAVQWAAFYSDCEHEVLPVTDGYRVTITYNLHYSTVPSHITKSPNWTGPFPLSEDFAKALQSESFMPHGGVLGVYCHHQYAHAANSPEYRVGRVMKGADAAMEAAALRFGLNVTIRPVYLVDSYQYEDYEDDAKAERKEDAALLFDIKSTSDRHLAEGWWKWIGDGFKEMELWENDYEEDLIDNLADEDWVTPYSGIHWLNEALFEEANVAYTTYGNEASSDLLYSAAALFILVPKWSQSRGKGPVTEEVVL